MAWGTAGQLLPSTCPPHSHEADGTHAVDYLEGQIGIEQAALGFDSAVELFVDTLDTIGRAQHLPHRFRVTVEGEQLCVNLHWALTFSPVFDRNHIVVTPH